MQEPKGDTKILDFCFWCNWYENTVLALKREDPML